MLSATARIWIRLILFAAAVTAQNSARLGGLVLDTTGSVIAGANITAYHANTGTQREVLSGNDGAFLFAALTPGAYRITIVAAGFSALTIEQFELTIAEQAAERFVLQIAGGHSAVEVRAGEEMARLQTADAQVSRVISMREIETLPLQGRDPLELAYYQPGVVFNGSYSVANGTRIPSTNLVLDGISTADPILGRMGLGTVATNTDSIAEFRIITSGGKAEYGRNAGAQIEMASRSGSNRWSGNLSDYLRNTVFDANSFFSNLAGVPRPVLIRNIFGASLGGPLRKNKTFIYANYQGSRIRSESAVNSTVLTDSASRGLFRWRSPGSAAINVFDIASNDPRRLGIDPTIVKYLALLPAANYAALGDGLNTSGFRYNSPNNSVSDAGALKVDHNLNDRLHFYLRFNQSKNTLTDSINGAQARFPGQLQGEQSVPSGGYSTGSDWTINPSTVLTFRIGRTAYDVTFDRPQRASGPAFTGFLFTNPISTAFSSGRKVPLLDLSESITLIRGRHTWKAGFRYQPSTDSEWTEAGRYPTVSLNPALVPAIGPSGTAVISNADRALFNVLYNNLLGRIGSVQQTFYSNDLTQYLPGSSPSSRRRNYRDAAMFVQDDWRAGRRLTINYGLRWEFLPLPSLDGAAASHLDKESLVDGYTPVDDFRIIPGNGAAHSYRLGFAPRLGFAWDPFGDGKTAIRAAWGIYYDRIQAGDFSFSDGNPGVSFNSIQNYNLQAGSDLRLADGIPAVQAPASVNLQLPVNRGNFYFMYRPSLRLPYQQQMNFTLEREIARQTLLDVAYVGSRGVQLQSLADYAEPHMDASFLQSFREIQAFQANGTLPTAANVFVRSFGTAAAALSAMGTTNVRVGAAGAVARNLYLGSATRFPEFYLGPNPQFGDLYVIGNDGRSYYNSLQISVRRGIGALRMSANYTWSKNIDNLPASDINGSSFSYQDLRDARGLSDTNVPRNFTVSASYSIPAGRGKAIGGHLPGLRNLLISNWDLGFINQMQDGYGFSVNSGYITSSSLSSQGNRADSTASGPFGKVLRAADGVSYFTPEQKATFTIPEAGQHGNSQRNSFRTPFFWNTNASLIRRFHVTERLSLLLRAEAFNALNRTRFIGINTNISSPTFGRISGTANSPRVMQLALRLDF